MRSQTQRDSATGQPGKDELIKRKSITIPDDVLAIGLRNAARRGHQNSFSAYLSWLIERDDAGAVVRETIGEDATDQGYRTKKKRRSSG